MKIIRNSFAIGLLCLFSLAASAQVPEELAQRALDADPVQRRAALKEVAQLRSADAVSLMLRALQDPEPMVSDSAQLWLAPMIGASTLELLLGKEGLQARDGFVQLRASEVSGRVQTAIDADQLLPALKAKDARTRAAGLWSLEQLLGAQRLEGGLSRKSLATVKKLLKDKSGHVAGAALRLLALADPVLCMKEFPSIASDRVPIELRAACFQVGSRPNFGLGSTRSLFLSYGQMCDEEVLRLANVEGMVAAPEKGLMVLLAAMLQDEQRPRLKWTIVRHLRELSGLKHGAQSKAWFEWASSLADDWRPGPKSPGEEAEDEAGTTSFVGLNVLSDRVIFLVDCSGSLWHEGEQGKTRKAAADIELRRALEGLSQMVQFNLIPYADEPRPWKSELVPASAKNVEKALHWFEALTLTGKGNLWDALMLALEDPQVDNLVVLTDGSPSGGQRWNLELMSSLFAERNRFRRVVLDALLVDCKPYLVPMWKALCGEAGGRVVEVEL